MLVFYHSYESLWVAVTIEVQVPKANPVVNRHFLYRSYLKIIFWPDDQTLA
jgi:hypothetical protein